MADKFLKQDGGNLAEVEATAVSTGAENAGDIIALDAGGQLDVSLMPTGIGADTSGIVASEAIAAGDFVNIYDDAGTAKIRKADGSTQKPVHGFVKSGLAIGETGLVYFEGNNNQIAGATVGPVYLSATTAGGFTSVPPSGTGEIVQHVGIAVSATQINMEAKQYTLLA